MLFLIFVKTLNLSLSIIHIIDNINFNKVNMNKLDDNSKNTK